jgi:hypothetical protein
MTEGIKSRDLLKYGEALSQGFQDAMQDTMQDTRQDTEQWRQFRERIISAEAGEAANRAGEALGRAVSGIADFVRAMGQIVEVAFPFFLEATAACGKEYKAALNEAPPRVRHLALHSKKKRVRNKNINRALREYRRRG